MTNILICDDNEAHLQYIAQLTLECLKTARVVTFAHEDDLLEYLDDQRHNINILIIDIELNTSNGIDIGRKIKTFHPNMEIIFISAHIRYFQDVYRVDHVYFLAKPIDIARFQEAIHKAAERTKENNQKFITVTSKNAIQSICLDDIYYIEAELRQVKIYTKDSVHKQYMKLGDFMKSLDSRFLHCHKSYVVNMDKVVKFSKNRFLLESGMEIPISQSKISSTKAAFVEYMGKK